jgi:hypothetical protein
VKTIIHIGMQKTGSTAIQQYLHLNRDELAAAGVLFPRGLGRLNQQTLPLIGKGNESISALHRKMKLTNKQSAVTHVRRASRRVRQQIRALRPRTLVLSSEQLSAEVRSPDDISRFAAWVRNYDSTPTIVVYLRRQDLWLLSRYSMQILYGATHSFEVPDTAATGPGTLFDYRGLVDSWSGEFGKENIVVRVFEREQLVGGDVVLDFMDVIGESALGSLPHPGHPNTSLDASGIEFMRLFNQHVPHMLDNGPNPMRRRLIPAMETLPKSGKSWTLPADLARDFVARFSEGNAEIARNYLGSGDERLFSGDFADGALPEGRLLSPERAVEIAAYLWSTAARELEHVVAG